MTFPVSRALSIWLTLVTVETIHGVIRRLVMEPLLGDFPARQVSVFTGALLTSSFSGSRSSGLANSRRGAGGISDCSGWR